jgi:hypothetical protein
MSAKDIIHDVVKRALIIDGWVITAEQSQLRLPPNARLYGFVDLLAEQVITAERAGRKIAVEIKSFLGDSPSSEFMDAVGQYQTYRIWMADIEPDREVWLAVSTNAANDVLADIAASRVLKTLGIHVVVVDLVTERIQVWQQ